MENNSYGIKGFHKWRQLEFFLEDRWPLDNTQNLCRYILLLPSKHFILGIGKMGINGSAVIARKTVYDTEKNFREEKRSTILVPSTETQPLRVVTSESFERYKTRGTISRHKRREYPPVCYCCSWTSHFPQDRSNNLNLWNWGRGIFLFNKLSREFR